MPQNQVIRTTGTRWDFLEPAMHPNFARTKHGVLKAAGSGAYLLYPKGQVVRQKDDGTNEFAKYGTGGYGGPAMIIKYPTLVNDAGHWQIVNSLVPLNEPFCEGSVDAYYQGFFACEDIISAGGTNEVQTETITATGGTRTLSFEGFKTAPIAFDANAAAIKAALLLAVPILATGDITITGTYIYTFGGNYAGSNVPPLIVDPTALTGGTSAIVETTPGAGLLTGIGRIIQGTSSVGIFQLGAATPV